MPVVAVDGRTGDGAKALADAIAAGFREPPIPHGLTAWSGITADADGRTADDLRSWAESRADARLDWTAGVLRGLDVHDNGHVTLSDRIDGVLLHPVVGVIVFLAVLFTVFPATTTLASPMQDWIDVTFRGWCASGLDWLLGLFGVADHGGWMRSLLVDGVLDGVTVLTFIPVMGIMFLMLSILEDSGYMARAAFVMDCAMRALGLDGRAFLPIIVGFGCNLPALAATRTLPDSRQRVLTGMLVPFVACSARLSVFLVLAHAFFPKYAGLVVFLMYVASVMIILLVGVVLRHTMFRGLEPEPLMLALPSYQCPRALQLVRSVLLRLWGFVRGASVIIIAMIVALWFLQGIPMTAGAGVFTFRAMMWCAEAELLRLAPVAMETAMRGEDPMIAGASVTTLLLVLVAGVAAGFVGYAVGASSLVSYPALLAFGIPPVLSNTTNTVGVCGTGIGGLLSARKELTGQGGRVAVYACIGLVGGVIGGLLLLELPAKVFEFAVPPLILFSALIIAFNPRRKAAARDAVARALPQSYQAERAARIADATANGALCDDPWWLWVGVSFVGIYSGYFGAAAGTLALAILDLGKIGPFHQINALKTVVGFGANISAAIMFIIRGSVYWPFAIMMCIGCTIGSAIAPPITRRIPEGVMRAAAVLTGIILAVRLGWSTYL